MRQTRGVDTATALLRLKIVEIRMHIHLLQDLIETGFHNLIEIDDSTRLKLLDYSKPPKH